MTRFELELEEVTEIYLNECDGMPLATCYSSSEGAEDNLVIEEYEVKDGFLQIAFDTDYEPRRIVEWALTDERHDSWLVG